MRRTSGRAFRAGVLLGCVSAAAAGRAGLVFSCAEENDLYQAARAGGLAARRCGTPAEAVELARPGDGVLLLADGYPATATPVDASLFERAAQKKARVFVEYPSMLPDLKLGAPRMIGWERAVVASDAFGPDLKRLRILMVHDCHFLPAEAQSPHLAAARVAGYDTAVFGLPDKQAWPLLFEHPRGGILVATTKLSQFITARYAPADAWPAVWRMVFGWLAPGAAVPELKWTPAVRPSFGKTEPLPADAVRQAVRRGVDWYAKGRLYLHPDWQKLLESAGQYPDRTGPGPAAGLPAGDGTLGLLEAYSSRIDWKGGQPVRWFLRADCNSEAAMALALRGAMDSDAHSQAVAANLLAFVLLRSNLQQGPRADPAGPSYGLLGWDTRPEGAVVYYGDDNARAVLGLIAASCALGKADWDAAIVRCALANFRTSCPQGFRNARIEEPQLQQKGWRWYWEHSDGDWAGGTRYSPHYQAYLWAVNLWLYDKTTFEPLLTRTKKGMAQMMKRFPEQWQYECGRKPAEYARMLLPLAWLVRVEDTPEHREWLGQVAKKLMGAQDACGAIGESVTGGERSNEEYGTREASLIFSADDQCADLLYTMNFAFLALHEAAAATGDRQIRAAEDRMADFLVRIQARSDRPSELDGAWFRGFDFRRWDYWGSNADCGWGVWATESGWTQGWIASVLALRQMKTSFWDFSSKSGISKSFGAIRPGMLPDEALQSPPPVTP
ncbi:MAG: hypothetical protein WCK89_05610 [bacterium]